VAGARNLVLYAYFRRTPKFRPGHDPASDSQPRTGRSQANCKPVLSLAHLRARCCSLSLSLFFSLSLFSSPLSYVRIGKGGKEGERKGAMKSVPTRGRLSGRLAGWQVYKEGKGKAKPGRRQAFPGAEERLRYTPSRIHPRPIPDLPELFFP